MNRSDLIKKTADAAGTTTEDVEHIVNHFFEIITDTLASGEPVNLRRFGKLEPRLRRAMSQPNPRSGETMEIPERLSVSLLPSDVLKERLNRGLS